jgi:hypothetical protein
VLLFGCFAPGTAGRGQYVWVIAHDAALHHARRKYRREKLRLLPGEGILELPDLFRLNQARACAS